jgi:DNA-binding NarL/FixJ family response regulator
MKRTAYPPETIAEIRRRYANGESSYKLADEYYMSQKGLYAYVADIKRPQKSWRKLTDTRIRQIRAAYMAGVKPSIIAEAAGIHRVTVHTYVRDLVKGA